MSNLPPVPTPLERAQEVRRRLTTGDVVSRIRIRDMGRIAQSLGIERQRTDPYDGFIDRIIKELEASENENTD